MSGTPRLFFSREELENLHHRRQADPVGRQLFYDFMAAAEWCRKQAIPAEPDPGPGKTRREDPVHPGQSPYCPDYLLAHEAFEAVTFAFERSVQQLSFAWLLTGERAWAERAVQWLQVAMNEWQSWGPKGNPLDQFAVRVMGSTMIGCDWLGDRVSSSLRKRCQERVAEVARQCLEAWGEGLGCPNPWNVGNHHWFNTSMLGMAALGLSEHDDTWHTVADRCGQNIVQISDWTIGPDGDYVDKPQFLLYAFRWALPFLRAWHRAGGPDCLGRPRLARAAQWLYDMMDLNDLRLCLGTQGLMDRWIFMLLAARHRLPHVQWLGLQLTDSPKVGAESYYSEWERISPTWCYLFYDETLAALPPEQSRLPRAAWARYSGWAILRSDSRPQGLTVRLYAGPASGKNYHDQGELLVSALGERLLEKPHLPAYGYLSAHRSIPYQMSNLSDSVLLADGLGQASGRYPHEWPGNAQVNLEVQSPVGKIICVDSGDDWSAVTADLTAAYHDFNFEGMWGCKIEIPPEWKDKKKDRLAQFTRRVLLLGQEWIILQDDLKTHPAQPVDLEWHFSTSAAVRFPQPNQAILDRGRASLDLFVIEPEGMQLSVLPAHLSETGKFIAVQKVQATGSIRLVLVMRARGRMDERICPTPKSDGIDLAGRSVVLGPGGFFRV